MTADEFKARYSGSDVPFEPSRGYPRGDDLFYECLRCHDVIPSNPHDSVQCSCGNFRIDVDYGRLAAKSGDASIRLLRVTERST
jgi:hypothetical protein